MNFRDSCPLAWIAILIWAQRSSSPFGAFFISRGTLEVSSSDAIATNLTLAIKILKVWGQIVQVCSRKSIEITFFCKISIESSKFQPINKFKNLIHQQKSFQKQICSIIKIFIKSICIEWWPGFDMVAKETKEAHSYHSHYRNRSIPMIPWKPVFWWLWQPKYLTLW